MAVKLPARTRCQPFGSVAVAEIKNAASGGGWAYIVISNPNVNKCSAAQHFAGASHYKSEKHQVGENHEKGFR
nr:hypothetical protein [Marinicella sp. W31]MDC2878800.1 hypothetical protein [Marinicella sp. W31]